MPDTDGATRPAPRVIHVPSPEGLGIWPGLVRTFAILLLGLGLVGVCLGLATTPWVVWLGIPPFIGCGVLAWWGSGHKKRYEQRRLAYVASVREQSADPVVGELAAKWKAGGKGSSDEDVKAAFASRSTADAPCAHVVCLGTMEVPEVGQAFFEPEIIAPTRYFGYQLIFVPIAAIVIVLWLLQVTGAIPGRSIQIGSFGYILWMGVAVGIAWVWRTVLRPTYIRMAPGVIQILEYRHRRAKPTVRSYPMHVGTLAILRGKTTSKKKWNLRLTLMRGEQTDTIEIWRMRGRAVAAERVWQALLSTAPTPPLSDVELVG